ncbi:MAG TPA: HupE/UreJ family protein [Bryobacteraceae bacterium]|nr:HupE/UreJ family protein [Bryobacteraceae bacterium]
MRFRFSFLILLFAFALAAFAHDIPNDVTVQAMLKPEGQKLRLLVRVPLRAIRDVNFPERGQGFLDLDRVDALLPDAATLWISDFIDMYEGDTRLPKPTVAATRIAVMSDRSFATYEEAMAHLTGPKLPSSTDLFWNQTMFDVLFEYPIRSDQSYFSIRPRLARLGLRVVTALRFLPPSGVVRAFEFEGDPDLVRLDPRWYQAALRFVDLGFHHILDGTDHLLFLFCLVIPFRKFRALIPIVTSFTVAHSITLIASAYNLAPDALWFPPLIEMLIAVSIVYMALENIVGGATVHRRWIITFGFGLVHGFGFSFALRQTLQFAGSHMLASLLSFNIGVELGQLLVLVVMIPALEFLFRRVVAERMGTIILSALVAHTAWHWMLERWGVLSQFHLQWPELTDAFVATALRWLMALIALAGLAWFVNNALRNRRKSADQTRETVHSNTVV